MNKRITLMASALFSVLSLSAVITLAAEQIRDQEKLQTQEQIYGSQLMTEQERSQYITRMHAANTAEERQQIREEHHKLMQERAKERGVILPDEPPARGGGMGFGAGQGSGGGNMGSGGKGAGGGR
jgi:uncharacterized membrane protein YgcG